MAMLLVRLNRKDYKEVARMLRNKGSALISTRRIRLDDSKATLKGVLIGDTLILCPVVGIKLQKTVTAVESNREPNDPSPAFIKCVPIN